ncbi:hypothetical protein M758_UG037100 [Ceratodon purpureus]|nr:hypothetical protein M758_UG037100 [Ceratodon purpureus]
MCSSPRTVPLPETVEKCGKLPLSAQGKFCGLVFLALPDEFVRSLYYQDWAPPTVFLPVRIRSYPTSKSLDHRPQVAADDVDHCRQIQ